jgi:hypothetical protein
MSTINYNWFNICNKDEFDSLDLYSKEYEVVLQDIGLKNILVTKGNYYSFLYEDIFLTYNLNSKNPFVFGDYAIYLDANNDFWLGIKVA